MPKKAFLLTSIFLISFASFTTHAESTVHVMLQEWRILTDKQTIPSGPVRISVQNRGQETHELVLLKSDTPYDSFKLHPEGGIDEAKAGTLVDELEDITSRAKKEMRVNLKPGNYVLLCNMVEMEDGEKEQHYAMGMRAPLIVR